ncbi:recombinase family protein [Pseudomonas reactans]|uniref:recombinase family protein n=1 Tax=Pseudomonas reactans TaxID=117680 RepID=UPI0015A2145F|nr:recombinase family protein [Pseudomonas reactans]NWF16991.1 recombinase family protein [Pseudomonas reactans]
MTAGGAKVFSYLRFSDPRQSTGSSVDRQLAYALAWATKNLMLLDETLTLKDEGLSAYHERHVKQGALGAFLRAIDEGRIPRGSVLIVEGLDRLSRAEPLLAQAQLAQIINGGVTVVTASDNREYNRASLKAQPMDLVYSLLVMIRAHEESDTKSKRVKAAIRRQCEGWIAGTYRGLIRNGKDPQWLQLTSEGWQLIPDRVAAVTRALELYSQGLGAGRAANVMHDEGFKLTEWGISGLQIYRMIKQPALRGVKRLNLDGEDYELEEYYPRVLSDTEWAELQHLASQRFRRRGAGEIPGIITGVGLAFCGYCGTAVVAQNIMNRRRADGTIADGHRRLHCTSYSKNGGCSYGGSCSVVPVERAVLSFCSDQINLTRLMQAGDAGETIQKQLVVARAAVAKITTQLSKVTDALLADESGAAPLAFVRKARELEAQQTAAEQKVAQLEHEAIATSGAVRPAQAERWAELAAEVEAGDYSAREKVRQLVMDTFNRIVIYMRGMQTDGRNGPFIDVQLFSRSGQHRLLRINRKNGDWVASEDWE